MIFQNYSQTFTAGLTALAGAVVVVLGLFGVVIDEGSVFFALGVIANFVGVIWTLVHRKSKGGIDNFGRRV